MKIKIFLGVLFAALSILVCFPRVSFAANVQGRQVSTNAVNGTSTITITKPSDVSTGVLMVAFMHQDGGIGVSYSTEPTGWSKVNSTQICNSADCGMMYYKIATGSEPVDYTWALNTSSRDMTGWITSYTGGYSVVDTYATAVPSVSPHTWPSVNTTVANALVVLASGNSGFSGATYTDSPPAGWNEIANYTVSGSDFVSGYDKIQASSGATGNPVLNFGNSGYGASVWTVAFKTATSATTTGNAGYSYNYFYSAGTVNNGTGNTLWYGTAWGAGSGYSGTACSALPNKTNYSTVGAGYNGAVNAYVSASASTLYYFCVYAWDGASTYYYSPTTYSLTTSAVPAPVINIYPAHTIDNVSAVIGSGTNAYGLAATGYFRYGTSNVACSSLPSTTTSGSAGSLDGNYYPNAVQLTGLTASTTYYYCYQATTTQGTTYSSVTSFTTAASAGTGCDLLPSSTLASAGDKTTIAGYLLSSKFAGTRVYQATVNGWTASAFHTAANAQGATITLYKNGNNNKIFGAYNPQSWTSNNVYNAGAGAFLFSLSDGYKLDQKNYATYQTYNNGNYGPTFGGGHDIGMNNATLNTQSGDYTNAHTYEAPSSKGAFTYLDGGGGTPSAYNFLPTEIEVYKLNICTTSAPTITTPTKTNIDVTTATLGGNVTSEGTASVTGRGVCVGTSINPALGGTCFSTTGTTGVFTVGATGLTQNTLYHYRAYATNSVGTSYTTDDTFTTLQGTPSVTTNAASSVAQTTATINGTANPNGFATTGWFRYYTSNPGTCSDTGGTRSPASSGEALGSGSTGVAYNRSLTGLTPGTQYWSCAIANNTHGTTWGSPVSFTTIAGAPTSVTTSTGESGLGSFYVTLNGSANPNNFASYGFFRVYTTNPVSCTDSGGMRYPADPVGDPYGDNDIPLGFTASPQTFARTVGTGLAPGTPYWYCAFAWNTHGIVGSSVDTFTTPDGAADYCDPPAGGNHTVSDSCSYTSSIGGVDAGTGTNNSGVLTVGAGSTLTMNVSQQVAWGTISMQGGANINLGAGSALRRGPIWVIDADADGRIGSTQQYIGAQPAGGVRRNTVNTAYPYFSKILSATTDVNAPIILDCNDNSAYAYRMIANLVKDADQDGYKTATAAGNQCVGASATINTRTYYNDGSGPN